MFSPDRRYWWYHKSLTQVWWSSQTCVEDKFQQIDMMVSIITQSSFVRALKYINTQCTHYTENEEPFSNQIKPVTFFTKFWHVLKHNAVFVRLDVHCAWAINQEKPEYCPLAYLGWNLEKWHLVATDGTTHDQESSALHTGALENVFSASFWANISQICLNYHRKCLDLPYTWDMIDIGGWF